MPSFTINVNGDNYTVAYDGTFNSPQGLLPALNNLGFGIFWIEEIGGNNVLTTVDDDDVWGTAETNADPTTTTTTTSSTTSTTTLGPITWTSTPSCAGSGINGTGVITVSGITGGSGTYLYAGIGDSEVNAAADVLNPATRTDITGPTVEFTGLVNDIYYIAIEDNLGGLHFSTQVNVSCNNTTTTTSTTTTTTAAPTTTTTTTTTTAAPTTSTTTTSTTVAGPTTTSTTTTTTTLFAQTVTYASSQVDACLNPTGSQNVTGNSTDFCTCTIFNSAGFITLPNGNYVLAYNGDTLNVNIAGAPSTTAIVYGGGGCGVCPLSTTTTTSTTTLQQVWYQMTNCNGGGTVYSTQNDIGYAALTDRVFGVVLGVPSTLVVTNILFSEPVGATLVAIINSGQTGCPSTSTTTTTTSLAVVTLSTTASCVGGGFNGNGRIVADSFAGGSGTYEYAGIGTSEANAISDAINPATRVNITGSSVTFNSLTNANYWVAITDSLGNIGISAQTAVSCNATTSTTTTTSTLAGVQFGISITTKYATDYLACASGTVTGTVYQKAEFGNTPTVGAQLYTSSTTGSGTEWTPSAGIGLYLMQFGGSTKWSVLVGTTGLINQVTSCTGVSTTTTTTTLPVISVTATPSCDGSGFSGEGRVTADFSGGTGSYTFAAIASSEANAIACVNNPACTERVTVAGSTSYAWTSLANGPYYVAVLDSNGSLGYSGLATVSCNATTTTTTTSSTTTTTTLAGVQFGVSISTKYATDFLACTGTVTGVIYQKAEFGNTPTVGAQLYTSSTTGSGTEWTPSAGIGLYLMQFGGSTKWSVLVGTTGIINTVTSCAGVSTTTTTTTLPPVIATATPSCDGSGFSGQGRVTSNFSGGTGSYTFAAIASSEANAIACVNNPSCPQRVTVAGSTSYAWTSLANGPYYVAVLDSNGSLGYSGLATVSCNATTTTTTTSSTTTTTTLAPTNVWFTNNAAVSAFAACTSPNAQYVWTYGNAWGAGIVFYAGTALAPSQPIQPFLGGGFFYENGGQVLNIDDNGVSSNLQACPSTTTTTAPPVYSYYVAQRCDNPSFEQYFRTTGTYIAGLSVRYQGYCWEIQALQGTFGADAESTYNNCASCYGTFPTTTTTSTTSTTTTATPAACTSWTVANFNGFGLGDYVDFTACDGSTQSQFIADNTQFDICVLDSAFPPQMQFGYGSVTSNGVPCT